MPVSPSYAADTTFFSAMLQSWVHRAPTPSSPSQTARPHPSTNQSTTPKHTRSFSAHLPSDFTTRIGRAISSSSLHLTSSPNPNSSPTVLSSNHAASASVPNITHTVNGSSTYYNDDDSSMSTLPDPRSRALSPSLSLSSPMHTPHPDLSDEVASLSNKLINAINHQTNLDDTLNSCRAALSASQAKVSELEAAAIRASEEAKTQRAIDKAGLEEMEEMIRVGSLVWEKDFAKERKRLVAEAAEETRRRLQAQKDKADIESELENLTTALFEEANKMVITAREEARRVHEEMAKKNEQLTLKLRDTEALLKLHQEQLAGLKHVMGKMDEELVELNARQSDEQSRPNTARASTDGSVRSRGEREDSIKEEADVVGKVLGEAPNVRRARRSVDLARRSLGQVEVMHRVKDSVTSVGSDAFEDAKGESRPATAEGGKSHEKKVSQTLPQMQMQ